MLVNAITEKELKEILRNATAEKCPNCGCEIRASIIRIFLTLAKLYEYSFAETKV